MGVGGGRSCIATACHGVTKCELASHSIDIMAQSTHIFAASPAMRRRCAPWCWRISSQPTDVHENAELMMQRRFAWPPRKDDTLEFIAALYVQDEFHINAAEIAASPQTVQSAPQTPREVHQELMMQRRFAWPPRKGDLHGGGANDWRSMSQGSLQLRVQDHGEDSHGPHARMTCHERRPRVARREQRPCELCRSGAW